MTIGFYRRNFGPLRFSRVNLSVPEANFAFYLVLLTFPGAPRGLLKFIQIFFGIFGRVPGASFNAILRGRALERAVSQEIGLFGVEKAAISLLLLLGALFRT